MGFRRFGVLGVSVLLALIFVTSVMAQVPYKVTLAPIFRPGVQLDSEGGDVRFVDVDLIARSNIEYWAMQISCTVNKLVLDSPYFAPGPVWYGVGGFVELPSTFNPATGVFTKTISMKNPSAPIGGGDVAVNLGTINFHVKELTAAQTSAFTCTSSFLDRNGVVVAPTTYVAPAPLSVLTGYQISGSVTYQGRPATANAGIEVTCGSNPLVRTNAAGVYLVSGRTAGVMSCLYKNPSTGPNIPVLAGRTWVQVGQGGTRIPPVSLPAGNTVVTPTIPATYIQKIDDDDVMLVTGNFGIAGVNANTAGNVNGDTKIDQADVALVASNYDKVGPVAVDHLLVTYARDYASASNKRAFLVNNATNTLTTAITANAKAYHAVLSPDGTKIAYVSEVTPAQTAFPYNVARYALFVAPAPGLAGAPVKLTPTAWAYDAFNPSWSEDGTMLAFICSKNYGPFADWYNDTNPPSGNLCTINPSGQNLSVRPEISELSKPAWYGSDGVLYVEPDLFGISYATFRGAIPSRGVGVYGHEPIWRGNTLFYLDEMYTTVIAASSANVGDPFNFPAFDDSAPPATVGDPYNYPLPVGAADIEAYEVSDLTNMIYVKPFDSNVITYYQYNGDPTNPSAPIAGFTLLPQYAYVSGCGCYDPVPDSIDYTP